MRPSNLKDCEASTFSSAPGDLSGHSLYMCGVGQFLCLGVGGALAAGVVMLTYRLNEKYGTYGLMKALAVKLHPRRITNRRRVKRLIRSSHV